MKLLTLNAHAHLEKDYEQKTRLLAEFILRERPDLVALQETSQPVDAPETDKSLRESMFPLPGSDVPLRIGNHAAQLALFLRQSGVSCHWAWLPVKLGYGRLDEGLAFLSLNGCIAEADTPLLTRSADYQNWKIRKALGLRLQNRAEWFYCVHMGWWNDPEEPFLNQWTTLSGHLRQKKLNAVVWLMGDFNSPAEIRGEGYDRIRADDWHDPWLSARETRGGATIQTGIDGWHERSVPKEGVRIDHIFCSRAQPILRAETVLDGVRGPRVSDHAGILLETEIDDQEE